MKAEDLKNKLRECIALHEELRDIFQDEGFCIKNDSPEGIAKKMNAGEHLRKMITVSNTELTDLFGQYSRDMVLNGIQVDDEIRTLFRQLREIIFATVGTVNDTVKEVKEARYDISARLKTMNRNKAAMKAYARTA